MFLRGIHPKNANVLNLEVNLICILMSNSDMSQLYCVTFWCTYAVLIRIKYKLSEKVLIGSTLI